MCLQKDANNKSLTLKNLKSNNVYRKSKKSENYSGCYNNKLNFKSYIKELS